MSGVPVFIEVAKAKEAQLCRTIVDSLMAQAMAPIGMATNMTELSEILAALKQNNLEASIFIINTFEAKEVLPQLDPLMGEVPCVFLRRGMYAGQSGLMEQFPGDPNKMATMMVLKKLTPRLTAIWTYGAKNAPQVTQRMMQCLTRFQADGNFRHFEISAKVGD